MKYGDTLYIPFDRNGNAYGRANCMPKVFTDTYSAKLKGFDEKILEKYVPERVINEDIENCTVCNAGKKIILYGVDCEPDTYSDYIKQQVNFCPICGRRLKK